MLAMIIVWALLVGQDPSSKHKQAPVVAEEGVRFSFKEDILEIQRSGGWLRFRRPVADFEIEFEFRAIEPETDAGLLIRTWTGRGEWPQRGYRLNLPTDAASEARPLFSGRKQVVAVVQQGQVGLRPSGEWQRLRVTGDGPRIRVMLNGTLAGEFTIEETWGYLLFENRKGRVQLRNIVVQHPELTSAIPGDVLSFKQVLDAGGQGPEVVLEVKPRYTADAMSRRVEGIVTLEAVVASDGSVRAARIVRSLDIDLDFAAVAALREWKFKPAVVKGTPVPVVVEVDLKFVLR